MTRSQLITGIWRERGYSDTQRRIDEEQAAKVITDNSVDHKRYKVYIDSIKRETEKAILAKVGHWRGGRQAEAWLPKSLVEFVNQHDALIPVWLARKFGYQISTDSKLND
jgi:hypothetical protein